MYIPDNPQSVEKYSAAVTLSDMEIFIFPELMYALVLANIMSPLLWQWRRDPWFDKLDSMSEYRRLLRTKQFIMNNFTFNLDLDTWGLTTKEKELSRFSAFIDESVLAESNALFGYEGDKYYFDLDIRRHFGLDKYTSNVIPYWKTETIEAMSAFRYKNGYSIGAGECVSLAALYMSALFVIARIPLSKMYMLATPLHSQNFVEVNKGVITNNRRVVTKNMWNNGTELSAKARRALENERVTILAHNTGYIHTLYREATIPPDVYRRFSDKLKKFLSTDISFEILANFLRSNRKLQSCFQIAHTCCGKPRYIEAEKVFHYEHSSKFRVGHQTQEKLIHEIDEDEFYTDPLPDRLLLDELESFFRENHIAIDNVGKIQQMKTKLRHCCYNVEEVVTDLIKFCRIEPRMPDRNKSWASRDPIELDGMTGREDVTAYLESIRSANPTVDLAFMAYRDLDRAPWKPFVKAALERNPVCVHAAQDLAIDHVAEKLRLRDNRSIYDGPRMAQPDEVWNFGRGDGLEKAVCLINIIRQRQPDADISLTRTGSTVTVLLGTKKKYAFETAKQVRLPDGEDFALS